MSQQPIRTPSVQGITVRRNAIDPDLIGLANGFLDQHCSYDPERGYFEHRFGRTTVHDLVNRAPAVGQLALALFEQTEFGNPSFDLTAKIRNGGDIGLMHRDPHWDHRFVVEGDESLWSFDSRLKKTLPDGLVLRAGDVLRLNNVDKRKRPKTVQHRATIPEGVSRRHNYVFWNVWERG